MTVSSQFLHLAILVTSGLVVAAVIDCVRVIKIEAPNRSRWTVLFELGIWLLLGVGTYLLLFIIKKGEWRVIDPLAQISGMLLYQSVFQRPLRFIGRLVWLLLLKPILLIVRGFIRVIRAIIRIILLAIMVVIRPILKIYYKFVPSRFKKM